MRDTSRDIAEILNYLHLNASQQSGRQALARFVIEHGRQWEAAECDPEFAGGRPLACYNNSQDMLQYDLRREAPNGSGLRRRNCKCELRKRPFPDAACVAHRPSWQGGRPDMAGIRTLHLLRHPLPFGIRTQDDQDLRPVSDDRQSH